MSDDLFYYKIDVLLAFSAGPENREALMTSRERSYLRRLPDEITIYRGMTKSELDSGKFGLSWSLKREIAEFYAITFQRNSATTGQEKLVHSITIKKHEVVAYFAGREEFEVIYISKDLLQPYRNFVYPQVVVK